MGWIMADPPGHFGRQTKYPAIHRTSTGMQTGSSVPKWSARKDHAQRSFSASGRSWTTPPGHIRGGGGELVYGQPRAAGEHSWSSRDSTGRKAARRIATEARSRPGAVAAEGLKGELKRALAHRLPAERERFLARASRTDSPRTRDLYRRALERLETWCSARGISPLELSPATADD
jgi:hypothetical protein